MRIKHDPHADRIPCIDFSLGTHFQLVWDTSKFGRDGGEGVVLMLVFRFWHCHLRILRTKVCFGVKLDWITYSILRGGA